MKLKLLFVFSILTVGMNAQNWATVNSQAGFIRSVDTFENKMYLAGGGFVSTFDGTNWDQPNFWANTPSPQNRTQYSIKNIDGKLLMGVKDFSTNGESIIHEYNGTSIAEKQGHRQFQYHANKKIMDFKKVGNTIYTTDYYSIFEWRDTSTMWRDILPKANVEALHAYNNKLTFISNGEIYYYDGTQLDSVGLSDFNIANGKLFGSASALFVKGNTLYACGNFTKVIDMATQQAETGNVLKITNGTVSLMEANFATPPTPFTSCQLVRIFVDDNDEIYCIGKKDPNVNDIHLLKYSNNTWSDVDKLVAAGQGVYPNIPGSEIGDYSMIFKYQSHLFVAGRFQKIAGLDIAGLAKFNGGGSNGLTKNTIQKMSAYPNPTNNTITLNGANGMLNIEVFGITGQMVLTTTTNQGQINLSDLNAGIYYVKATNKNQQVFLTKVVKQ